MAEAVKPSARRKSVCKWLTLKGANACDLASDPSWGWRERICNKPQRVRENSASAECVVRRQLLNASSDGWRATYSFDGFVARSLELGQIRVVDDDAVGLGAGLVVGVCRSHVDAKLSNAVLPSRKGDGDRMRVGCVG